MAKNHALVLRGRMGAHAPNSSAPDPELYAKAKAELAEYLAEREAQDATDRIAAYVERVVAKAPPLSAHQRARITQALTKAGA
jgi:hypothetical protein